jgi:hypothetical protein
LIDEEDLDNEDLDGAEDEATPGEEKKKKKRRKNKKKKKKNQAVNNQPSIAAVAQPNENQGIDCGQTDGPKNGIAEGDDNSTLMSEDPEFEEDLKQFSLRLHMQQQSSMLSSARAG